VKRLIIFIASLFMATSLFAAQFNKAQTKAIQKIIRNYIVNNPQVLVEASQNLQEQRFKKMKQANIAGAKKYSKELFRNPGDIVMGDPNGKVTLVEFFDYLCPYCKQTGPAIANIMKKYPHLRVVFKDFIVHGTSSVLMAQAAYAAKKQGKYMELRNAMLAMQKVPDEKTLMQAAKKIGLNTTQFTKDMKANKAITNKMFKNNMALAVKKLQLIGTPAFFVGPTNATVKSKIYVIPGLASQKELDTLVKKAQPKA